MNVRPTSGAVGVRRRKASPNPEVKAIIEQSRQQAGLVKAGISVKAFGPQARVQFWVTVLRTSASCTLCQLMLCILQPSLTAIS